MAEQGLEGSQPVDLKKHPSGIVPTLQWVLREISEREREREGRRGKEQRQIRERQWKLGTKLSFGTKLVGFGMF